MQLTCAGNLGQFLSKEKTDALLNKLASGKKTDSFLKLFALRVLSNIGLHRAYDVKVVNKCLTVLVSVNSVETEVKLSDITSVSLDHFPEYGYEPYMTFDVDKENAIFLKLHVGHMNATLWNSGRDRSRKNVYPSNARSLGSRFGLYELHTDVAFHSVLDSEPNWVLLTEVHTDFAFGHISISDNEQSDLKPYVDDTLVLIGTHWTPACNDTRNEKSTVLVNDENATTNVCYLPDSMLVGSKNRDSLRKLKELNFNRVDLEEAKSDLKVKVYPDIVKEFSSKISEIKSTVLEFDNLVLLCLGYEQEDGEAFAKLMYSKITLDGEITFGDLMNDYGRYHVSGYYQKAE